MSILCKKYTAPSAEINIVKYNVSPSIAERPDISALGKDNVVY